MTTYTQSSHPLDVAAGIRAALDTDDLRVMLADVLPGPILDALTEYIDGIEEEADKDITRLTKQVERLKAQGGKGR